MADYICEICGKQEAENFRFEYGVKTSYQRTSTGTTTKGVFDTPYETYQTQTTYKVLGEDTVHLCLNCIKERVRAYRIINYAPVGVGVLLLPFVVLPIPAYFITRHCLIKRYGKAMSIDRQEIRQAIRLGMEALNQRWKDKQEVVYYYQYKKIEPLKDRFKKSGQLNVQGENKELIVIPAFVHDKDKDPDFKRVYRI